MSETTQRYLGKYRGEVVANNDPDRHGRVRVKVESIDPDNDLGWAMPCAPYAGDNVGFFTIPPERASVWVEFENGDLEKPIWSGCFWSSRDGLPVDNYSPDRKVLKTGIGTITIDDTPGSGSLIIETTAGMKLVMNTTGIELTNGQSKIKLTGPTVSINDTALEVT